MSKWSKQYWTDLGERAGSTFLQSLAGTSLLMGTTAVDWSDHRVVWATLGAPTALSLVKGLLVNLGTGDTPTASLVKVTSNGEPDPVHEL